MTASWVPYHMHNDVTPPPLRGLEVIHSSQYDVNLPPSRSPPKQKNDREEIKRTVPCGSSSRSERRGLPHRCQPTPTPAGGGREGGGAFVACLCHLAIDHASLSRRSRGVVVSSKLPAHPQVGCSRKAPKCGTTLYFFLCNAVVWLGC